MRREERGENRRRVSVARRGWWEGADLELSSRVGEQKPSGTKTLRKATATQTTVLGSPFISPSPSVTGVSHLPSTSALANTQRCDPPAGGCPELCLSRLPTRGLLLPLPTRAHLRRLQGAGNAAAAASSPTSRGPAPLPSPRGCAARSRSSTPAEGTFVSRETFCLFPSSASRGDRPAPGDQNGSKHGRGGGWRRLQRRSQSVRHPHPTPRPGKCPGSALDPRGNKHQRAPCAAPPSLNFPTGPEPPTPLPSRSPRPPVSSTLRPHSARGRRARRESPAPLPAANSPASAGAASREQARRGRRRGKAAPPTPAATGCRSGSQPLADPRRLRRAGLRRRSRLPALAEESEPPGGTAGRSRVAKPPGQHGSRAAESRRRPTNPLGGAGVGARRAGRRRRPAEAAGPDTGSSSLGPPDGTEPTRRSPLRVRRFLTRRLRIDASACFPGESERERKKDFYWNAPTSSSRERRPAAGASPTSSRAARRGQRDPCR